ncbi:MAG: flippase-like domain-containing protein [Gammaproteobacteria bacterium]
MRFAKLVFFMLGLGLLAYVLSQADLRQIWQQVAGISLFGILAIFTIYALYFAADVISWQFTFETIPMTLHWARRLYLIRMIGEAYNNITPMGSIGGEPLKAWLLKSNYRVPLQESGASLILAKTASMFSLVLFVMFAVFIAFKHPNLTDAHRILIVAAFAWFVFNIVVFFLMQHLRLSSFAATRIGRSRFGAKLSVLIAGMHGMDDQFARFYGEGRSKLWWAMGLAMANWAFGTAELYAILYFIGHPVSWTEAWLIESMLQLIRTVVFFIPAGLGAQEGTLMFAYAAITGNPTPGLAAALVRRFRELVWISLSLLIGSGFKLAQQSEPDKS